MKLNIYEITRYSKYTKNYANNVNIESSITLALNKQLSNID